MALREGEKLRKRERESVCLCESKTDLRRNKQKREDKDQPRLKEGNKKPTNEPTNEEHDVESCNEIEQSERRREQTFSHKTHGSESRRKGLQLHPPELQGR